MLLSARLGRTITILCLARIEMRALIIGKDSYIGNHVDEWLTKYGWEVTQLDSLTSEWKTYNYSLFDVIIHVAAIVHHPQCRNWNLYKSVNADLPIEIATIAKAHGAHSFIFFSTMGVYQAEKRLKPSVIDENTPLEPKSFYGKSKLLAEEGLAKLNDANFHVAIVRPPSVYGKGCKGGYITGFTRIARLLPVIPNAYNDVCQSFIFVRVYPLDCGKGVARRFLPAR